MLFGAFAMLFNLSSCGKDNDPGVECCTLTVSAAGYTLTNRSCADGTRLYTYNDGSTNTDSWSDGSTTWSQQKFAMEFAGANCR